MTKITAHQIPDEVRSVIDRLEEFSHQAMIAGGAVRDTLLGQTPKDWDVATTAMPEQVVEIFQSADFPVIETGLQHGTVTVMVDSVPIEITTLRVDEDTDGRHATVRFTRSWAQDANRRDFTINALFMDKDGAVHDFVGGLEDIFGDKVKIRFVGDPNERIQEDFLRIMRFFRFCGRFGARGDDEAFDAIATHADGLRNISGERIWSELGKILTGPNVDDMLHKMRQLGVMQHIGLPQSFGDRFFARWTDDLDATMAMAMGIIDSGCDVVAVRERFRLSNDEFDFIRFCVEHQDLDVVGWREEAKQFAAWHGVDTVRRFMRVRQNFAAAELLEDWTVPAFPVTGKDLIEAGMNPGPEMGKRLHQMKTRWVDSMFILTAGEMLRHE